MLIAEIIPSFQGKLLNLLENRFDDAIFRPVSLAIVRLEWIKSGLSKPSERINIIRKNPQEYSTCNVLHYCGQENTLYLYPKLIYSKFRTVHTRTRTRATSTELSEVYDNKRWGSSHLIMRYRRLSCKTKNQSFLQHPTKWLCIKYMNNELTSLNNMTIKDSEVQ